MIEHRDLVAQNVRIGRVERNPLHDDRLIVTVEGDAARFEQPRTFQPAGFHFKNVVASVGVLADPAADGVARKTGHDLAGPAAAIGMDLPEVAVE